MEIIKRLSRLLYKGRDYNYYDGAIIPPPELRWCGSKFKDDEFFVRSAEQESHRLVNEFQCDKSSRILDVGCGQGRLPIGILRVIGELDYLGLDVHRDSIRWCKQNIQSRHPSFRFQLLNIKNERYNPGGTPLDERSRFDIPRGPFDIIYLYSVFSHMNDHDVRIYLEEFRKILGDGGGVFLTAYVENDVPNVSVNPDGYVFESFSGPLHVVRFEKSYLFSIIENCGFILRKFTHQTEDDRQSALYLKKTDQC